MAHRMVEETLKIASRHAGGKVLIVSHAAAIRAFWGEINGLSPDRWAEHPFPSNASYSVVECDGETITPVLYSEDAHLGDMATNIKH